MLMDLFAIKKWVHVFEDKFYDIYTWTVNLPFKLFH